MKAKTMTKQIIEVRHDKKNSTYVFCMELAKMPKKYCELAKKLDGNAYTESCFAFHYKYTVSSNRFFLETKNGNAAYYLDENGDMHYLDYTLPANVLKAAEVRCRKMLKKLGVIKTRNVKKCKTSNPVKEVIKQVVDTCAVMACTYKQSFIDSYKKKTVAGQLALF